MLRILCFFAFAAVCCLPNVTASFCSRFSPTATSPCCHMGDNPFGVYGTTKLFNGGGPICIDNKTSLLNQWTNADFKLAYEPLSIGYFWRDKNCTGNEYATSPGINVAPFKSACQVLHDIGKTCPTASNSTWVKENERILDDIKFVALSNFVDRLESSIALPVGSNGLIDSQNPFRINATCECLLYDGLCAIAPKSISSFRVSRYEECASSSCAAHFNQSSLPNCELSYIDDYSCDFSYSVIYTEHPYVKPVENAPITQYIFKSSVSRTVNITTLLWTALIVCICIGLGHARIFL